MTRFALALLLIASAPVSAQSPSVTPTPAPASVPTRTPVPTSSPTASPSLAPTTTPTEAMRPPRSKDLSHIQGVTFWGRSYQARPGEEPALEMRVSIVAVDDEGRVVEERQLSLEDLVAELKRRGQAHGASEEDIAAGTAAATRAGQFRAMMGWWRERFERRWLRSGTPTPLPTPTPGATP